MKVRQEAQVVEARQVVEACQVEAWEVEAWVVEACQEVGLREYYSYLIKHASLTRGRSSSSPSAGVPFVVTLQSAGQSGSQSPQAAQYPTKLGGFSYNPAESVPYTLNSDGTLSTPDGIYSVSPGTTSEPFVPGTPAPGAITGTWSINPDGTLSWTNPAFSGPGNAAAFYEDPSGTATSGIIAVFDGSVPPAPYIPVELKTNPGKSRYSRILFVTNEY